MYHSRVIKRHIGLMPKIVSGYAKTLLLGQTVLRTVEFALIAECNSKCIMCYASKIKKEDDSYLTVDEYRTVWQQASRLGAFSAVLSGGEPTLRHDLFDIISVMEPSRTIFALVTNSLVLDRPFLSDLKKAGVATIHFSLDSTNPMENDLIRGAEGHFVQAVASIEEAKRLGFAVYISTVVMHGGLARMREMVRFARAHDIGIVFSLACVSGNWSDESGVLITPEEWGEIQRYMRDNPDVRSDWTINFSMRQECPGGREKLSISCYGDVTGCGMNYVSFGNIREEPLERIWRRMGNFPDFKRRSRDCLIGADPDYIERYLKPLANMQVPVRVDRHPTHPISFESLDKGK
jgi:MoaA/NifB/PqqE/SkfB family radical SAM enzyme